MEWTPLRLTDTLAVSRRECECDLFERLKTASTVLVKSIEIDV